MGVSRQRSARAVGLVLLAVALVGALSAASVAAIARRRPVTLPAATVVRPPAGAAAQAVRPLTLVGLGDSVPAASACPGCTGFVTLYGRGLAARTGAPVQVRNLAVPGLTSAGLLAMLAEDPVTDAAVASADVVTITIGANDVDWQSYDPRSCADLRCYTAALATTRENVDGILTLLHTLRGGRPTAVRVTGYWNVWPDGAVARAKGATFVTVSRAVTRLLNTQLAAAARAAGDRYVDLVTPFLGPRGTDDDTGLLAPDGDHPSQRGHAVIAATLLGSGLAPLRG